MSMQEWRSNGHRRRVATREVQARYGWVCWICGTTIDRSEYSVDHLIPQSHDATLTWNVEFMRPAHRRCNSSRGNRRPRTSKPKRSREW